MTTRQPEEAYAGWTAKAIDTIRTDHHETIEVWKLGNGDVALMLFDVDADGQITLRPTQADRLVAALMAAQGAVTS